MKLPLFPVLLFLGFAVPAFGVPPGAEFPEPTPVADANPAVRNPVDIKVPTKLAVTRTADRISVTIDYSDKMLEAARIDVGSKMVTGIRYEEYVYPEGAERPKDGRVGLIGGGDSPDFKGIANGQSFYNSKDQLGIPKRGVTYVVEMKLEVFETDIPAQHMWGPQGSKKYKVLWTRTLKQVVPP